MSDPAAGGELTHRQIVTVLSGLLIGMFLAALDQTVVTTAMKTIGNDLNDLSAQAWATSAFLITSTISAPLFGKLSDIYGRKRLFMLSIVVFVVGSALCGLATSMYELAGFRALQGLGAGGLVPLALAIMADIIPARQRARYQGYIMIVFTSASVLGPVVGGLLAGAHSILGVAGWRLIFYLNVPIAVVALLVIARVLGTDHAYLRRHVDWYGALVLAFCMVPLLLIAEQGQAWGWASIGALGCYGLGVVNLILFLWIEKRLGDDALLPLRLFRSNTFTVACAQMALVGLAMFGELALIPLYLQVVRGASPSQAGLLILPQFAGVVVTTLIAARVTGQTGRYKIFPVVGSILMVAGMGLMTRVGAATPLWQTDVYIALFGCGLGFNSQSLVLAMQNAVRPEDTGVASASAGFFRSVGGTLGTAVFVAVLFSLATGRVKAQYADAVHRSGFMAAVREHPAQYLMVREHLSGNLNNTSFLNGVPRSVAHPFLVGFSSAVDAVSALSALCLVGSVILTACWKELPLVMVSGNRARAHVEPEQAV